MKYFTMSCLLFTSLCCVAAPDVHEIGKIEKSEFSDYEKKQCKIMGAVVQRAEIRQSDICKYKLGKCDKSIKPWKKTTMFCLSESDYSCYKNDLWKETDPTMTGFAKKKYPYISNKPKVIDGIKHTQVCVYW